MKKFYVLMSVMVLALMTAGFSYAYWSDSLTVTGTSTTGSFGVEFIPATEVVTVSDTNTSISVDYVDLSGVSTTADQVTFTLGNLYPGAVVKYEVDVKNVGSIPAVLHNFTYSFGLNNNPNILVTGSLGSDDLMDGLAEATISENGSDGDTQKLTITVSVPDTLTETELPYGSLTTMTASWDYKQFNE